MHHTRWCWWFGLVSFEKLRSTWNWPIKWSAVDQNEFGTTSSYTELVCWLRCQHRLCIMWQCTHKHTLWILWLWLEWRSDIWSVGQRASWKVVRNEKQLRCVLFIYLPAFMCIASPYKVCWESSKSLPTVVIQRANVSRLKKNQNSLLVFLPP